MLDKPAVGDEMDRAELLMKRLANHFGGDLQVCHRAALLRCPGKRLIRVPPAEAVAVPLWRSREGRTSFIYR
jgi:hypothetical protein